jgi:hypothetical protein
MKAVMAGEGVRIEAKATVGVVKLDSIGTVRGNRGLLGWWKAKNSVSRQGVTHHAG